MLSVKFGKICIKNFLGKVLLSQTCRLKRRRICRAQRLILTCYITNTLQRRHLAHIILSLGSLCLLHRRQTILLLSLTGRRLHLANVGKILHLLTSKLTRCLTQISKGLYLLTGKLSGGLAKICKNISLLAGKLACGLANIGKVLRLLSSKLPGCLTDVGEALRLLSSKLTR